MDLTTQRLKVRTFELGDVAQAWAYLSDPEVMRHIEAPFDLAATRAFIQGAGIAGNLVHAVVCRSTPRLLGHLIWHPWITPGTWEIGWVLRKDAWGQGFATELTRAVLAHARSQPDIDTVIGETEPDNHASIAVLERAGLRRRPDLDDDLPVWAAETP